MELFENNLLAGIKLSNRFVRSATNESMAEPDGIVTPKLVSVIETLASGDTGLIITGHSYVSAEGQANSRKLAIDRDACIPGLKEMADAAHRHGSAIVIQLAHAGALAMTPESAMGPSPILRPNQERPCREMSHEDIDRLIDSFVSAAIRAKTAGFDGVQIHAAHGYLLAEFLSPFYNKRTDEYGGDIINRSRIIVAILKAIKNKAGKDFPVMIKINSEDFVPGGLTVNDSLEAIKMLEKNGLDAVEISGGLPDSIPGCDPVRKGEITEGQEIYYRDAALKFKQALTIPVILVGGIRSLSTARRILSDKMADYVALSRPLIREPDLVKRWREGDESRAKCISCNQCFRPMLTGQGIMCMIAEKERRKARNIR